MISTRISRASAAVLAAGGMALLFAADAILPRVSPGFPVGSAWVGQLLGAAWLGLAALNWIGRGTLLGGIYGRSMVMANAAFYFIATTVLVPIAQRAGASPALRLATLLIAAFTVVYVWLFYRGPVERDIAEQRGDVSVP